MFLTIDVCGPQGSIAVGDAAGFRESIQLPGKKHSESLAPAVTELIASRRDALKGVGVVTGPGTFTGIRVGISLAMGMTTALDLPLFGATKFDLILAGLQPSPSTVRIVIPGAPGRVFLAIYEDTVAQPKVHLVKLDDLDPSQTYVGPSTVETLNVQLVERDLLDVFLGQMLEGRLEPTPFPRPLYVKPPDVRNPTNLLEKLLSSAPPADGQRGNKFVFKDE